MTQLTHKFDQAGQIADTQINGNKTEWLMNKKPEKAISLVTRDSIRFFASMFEETGKQTFALLRSATIPSDIFTDTDYGHLPESSLKNFFVVLPEHLSDNTIGWLFLRQSKEILVPGFLTLISSRETVKEALEQFCQQLKQESSGAELRIEYAGNTWWLVREKSGSNEAWFKYAEMFSVICMAELLRALTNHQWRPARIGIQSPDIEDFTKLPSLESAQFFIDRPVTAVEIPEALLFSPVFLTLPVPGHKQAKIPERLDSLNFAEQFTIAIKPYLSMGKLPIKVAAEILRMNVRTLQRKLSAENIVYKEFVEELVFKDVAGWLIASEESITQIANRFGYSDAAHFTRAFKRIYGCSPSQYRSIHRN